MGATCIKHDTQGVTYDDVVYNRYFKTSFNMLNRRGTQAWHADMITRKLHTWGPQGYLEGLMVGVPWGVWVLAQDPSAAVS